MFFSARMRNEVCGVMIRHTDLGIVEGQYRTELVILKDDGMLAQRKTINMSKHAERDFFETRLAGDLAALDDYGIDLLTLKRIEV